MHLIEKIDDTIPRGSDNAPGTPGNTAAQELREVRSKINEIIDVISKLMERED
jgi:hypothetical protein